METGGYLALTFESTHAAMAAQKHLKGRVRHAVMPVPRCISASCGIAIRVEEPEQVALEEALQDGFPVDVKSYALYRIDGQDCAEKLAIV